MNDPNIGNFLKGLVPSDQWIKVRPMLPFKES